jgi:hypothetical protein
VSDDGFQRYEAGRNETTPIHRPADQYADRLHRASEADMDSNGEGFFSSWDDFRKDLKTQEFKDELDAVINELLRTAASFTIAGRFQSLLFHAG